MLNESIIKNTGQWWKLGVSFVGEILGVIIMFFGLSNLENDNLFFS